MVLFLVIGAFIAIAVVMFVMWRDSQSDEIVACDHGHDCDCGHEHDLALTAPGKPSVLMTIPRKHPAVRTRHSRSLR